jgi:hypothetical protein
MANNQKFKVVPEDICNHSSQQIKRTSSKIHSRRVQKSKNQHQSSIAILSKKRTGQMSTYKTACSVLVIS